MAGHRGALLTAAAAWIGAACREQSMSDPPPRDDKDMSRRSPAGAHWPSLWSAIGSLMAVTMMSTAPSQAAEPDRQDQPLVCAQLAPGKLFSLIPRGDNRGGRS